MEKEARETKEKMEKLFGNLSDQGADPLAVQLVTLESRTGDLISHVYGKDVDTTEKYWEASEKFIYGSDDEQQLVRSLVYLRPQEVAYSSVFGNSLTGYLKYFLESFSAIWKKRVLRKSKWKKGNYFSNRVPDTETAKDLAAMKAPYNYDEATKENLTSYFCDCLSDHLLENRSLGTLVWLYNVASEEKRGSLFAVFAGRVGKNENEVLHFLNEFLQERTVSHYARRLHQRALETAISNIFARNFAHNIGSHVASNATNEKVKERIRDLYCQ